SRSCPSASTRPLRLSSTPFLHPLPFFFFYYSGHHPDLHSFPTRRSSDLNSSSEPSNIPGGMSPVPFTAISAISSSVCSIPIRDRSEEHTSELQSRFDLVCRLLLEKKKNYYNDIY